MPIVYKITNRVNGKIYFGLTTRSLKQRFDSHLSAVRQGSNFRFHSAIRKYGVDSWDLEVVEESDDMDYIRRREEELIAEYNTTLSAYGYNAKPGGCGGWIVKPENYDRWRENQRISSDGVRNPRFNGCSNEELYELVKKEALELGCIPSQKYMVTKHYPLFPKSFSKYRFNESYKNLVEILQTETGLPFDPYKKTDDHRAALSRSSQGKRWHTDGTNNVLCLPEEVPIGYYRGRTSKKEEANA